MSIQSVRYSRSPVGKEEKKCEVNPFIQLNGKHVYSILKAPEDFVPFHAYPTRRAYTVLSQHGSTSLSKFMESSNIKCALPPILAASDLEVIPDSSDFQELNQIRAMDAIYYLDLYDKISQGKTSLKIDGSTEFREAVLNEIQILLTRPGGRQLIGTLCSTINNSSVIIQEGEKNRTRMVDGDPNFYITLNLKDVEIAACRDGKGDVHFEPIPNYLALAHEIIHVLHTAAATEKPGSLPSAEVMDGPYNRFYCKLNEKLTICGLPTYPIPCENKLRVEFGLMSRISHTSSTFLDYTSQDCSQIETLQNNVNRLENAVFFKAYGEIRKLLKDGANPGNAFYVAIRLQDLEMIRFLLQEGASPYSPNRCGDLPLHLAAKWNLSEIVKLFIDYGIQIDQKDPSGQTALQAALQHKALSCAFLLIANGAPFTPDALASLPNAPAGLREEFVKFIPYELDHSKPKIVKLTPTSSGRNTPSPKPEDNASPRFQRLRLNLVNQ